MTWLPAVVLSNDSAAVDFGTFKELADVVLLGFGGYAVVAENGVGGHQNLPFVGGVGKAFGVAGHSGIENHLTGGRSFITKRLPFEEGAVFK